MKIVKPVETIEDLENALSNYPPETPIAAAWEGQQELIYVCQDEDGTVLLDVDGGWKARELSGP